MHSRSRDPRFDEQGAQRRPMTGSLGQEVHRGALSQTSIWVTASSNVLAGSRTRAG